MADAEASGRITVRHLLNQTSGIANADGLVGMLWSDTDAGALERHVRFLADRPLRRASTRASTSTRATPTIAATSLRSSKSS